MAATAEQVSRLDVLGYPRVAHHDVAASQCFPTMRPSVGAASLVVRPVARRIRLRRTRSGCCRSSAVDADVATTGGGADRTSLTVPTRYTVIVPGPAMAVRARRQPGRRQTDRRRLAAHDGAELGGGSSTGGGSSCGRYAMPKPPPRSTVAICAVLSTPIPRRRPQQADHPVRGDLESGGVEYLRADVAVQPDQPRWSVANTRRTAASRRRWPATARTSGPRARWR